MHGLKLLKSKGVFLKRSWLVLSSEIWKSPQVVMSDSSWGVSLWTGVVSEPCELTHDTDEFRQGFIDMSMIMMFMGQILLRGHSLASIIMTITDCNAMSNPLQESDTPRNLNKPKSQRQVNCQSILAQLDKKTGHWHWARRFTRFMSSWTKYDARCGNASNARMSRWKMATSPAGFCMSDLLRLWNTGHTGMSKVIWKKGACWWVVQGDGILEASTFVEYLVAIP